MAVAMRDVRPGENHPTSTIADNIPQFPIDKNIIRTFPSGTKVVSVNELGKSSWATRARLQVELANGTTAQYFLKSALGKGGRLMMEGEYRSMLELYKTMPELVPKPHGWGKYSIQSPKTYFFIAEFIHMSDETPEPDQLCAKLAQLHQTSTSPTGQYGFHITTCQGRVPQAISWDSKWTTYFTTLLKHVVDLDTDTNGPWFELAKLEEQLLAQVVPILLDNLVKDGHSIKPCLIHGDLWEGNIGTSPETGDIYLFDAAAMYAHHEMEIGNWRCHYNRIGEKRYTETYYLHQSKSEPEAEWHDRNRLYSIYYNVLYSVNHMDKGKAVRQT